jgi:hypothetical protein
MILQNLKSQWPSSFAKYLKKSFYGEPKKVSGLVHLLYIPKNHSIENKKSVASLVQRRERLQWPRTYSQ